MNEDIIRMAREAGLERDGDNFFSKNYEEMDVHIDDLKRFAELVRADEREACSRVCEDGVQNATDWDSSYWDQACQNRAAAIRARSAR